MSITASLPEHTPLSWRTICQKVRARHLEKQGIRVCPLMKAQAHNPGAFSHLCREGTCTKQAEQAARCSGVNNSAFYDLRLLTREIKVASIKTASWHMPQFKVRSLHPFPTAGLGVGRGSSEFTADGQAEPRGKGRVTAQPRKLAWAHGLSPVYLSGWY